MSRTLSYARIAFTAAGGLVAVLLLVWLVSYKARSTFLRPSGDELNELTVSQSFEPWTRGSTATLIVDKPYPGSYEIGFEFPTRKLEKRIKYKGILRIEVFEGEKQIVAKDVSGTLRSFYADSSYFREIVLEEFELPVYASALKFVITTVQEDQQLSEYEDLELFVRPSTAK